MKKFVVLLICAVLHLNSWALGGYGSLSADDKKIAKSIKDYLLLSEDDAYQVFSIFVKGHVKDVGWSFDSYENDTLKGGKIENSKNRMLHLNFVTTGRFVNISFFKFATEKQILIQTVETLPRSNEKTLKAYNEIKNDSLYEVSVDRDAFSAFRKNGMTDRVKYIVNSDYGGIQYVEIRYYDLK